MSEMDEREQTPAEGADTVEGAESQAPAEAGEAQDTPKKIAGKYDSWDDAEKALVEAQRKIGEQGEELGRLRTIATMPMMPQVAPYQGYPQSAPVDSPKPKAPVSQEEWFSDPEATAEKLINLGAERALGKLREENARAAQISQLATQFYAAHKDLDPKRDKPLVNYYADELTAELNGLHPYQRQQLYPDPMKEVARRVRDHKAELLNEARTKQQTTQPPHVGPGGGVASAPTSTAPAKPKTAREQHDEYMAELRAITNK
jgi:hypothetical protein